MFSKSLFKQSCKANGVMWTIITVAVCFMLACVMLISGGSGLGKSKAAIEDTIIKGELTSKTQQRAVTYYEISSEALTSFDTNFLVDFDSKYKELATSGTDINQAKLIATKYAYSTGITKLTAYVNTLNTTLGYEESSIEAQEIKAIIFYIFNPLQEDGTYMFDSFYNDLNETPAHYFELIPTISEESHKEDLKKYAMKYSAIFLSGNMVKEDNINEVLKQLASYGVTKEMYDEYGYSDYNKLKDISDSVLINYTSNIDYRIENMKEGETIESIKADIKKDFTQSLLASLPSEVSDALDEIGQADLYGTLVGSIFFKMAGLLLPIIYMIMSSNALIAGQVDSGSMAYVLATGTKRREVVFTQAVFLVSSLLLMFTLTSITSIVCLLIVDVDTKLTIGKLLLINLGSFLVMFAMSGICFFASCVFNRSKHSMALGGGLNMFFLVATMLGLFGSKVLPSIIRMDALNLFNFVSIISLFDVISILDCTLVYLWKFAILIAVGLSLYFIGSKIFIKKDLPL